MKATFKTIDPREANDLLEKHNDHNRKLRESYVNQLAEEMRHGRWQETHQAIGINCDGSLIDGQHRLAAIVASGKSQRFLVVSGVPKEAIRVIDSHSHRRTRDALALVHGIQTTDRSVSCALFIDSRGQLARRLPAERIEIFLRHKRIIERTEKIFDTNLPGICRANVMAVVARALSKHSAQEIEPFCRLLVTGESRRRRDAIVIKLRDFLMTKVAGQGGRGTAHVSSYKRTEYALDAWLRNDGQGALFEAKEELFPLTGETSVSKEEVAKKASAQEPAKKARRAKGQLLKELKATLASATLT
ncbi:MAG TPA: hypothetical protein VFA98_15390 [Thermoanaerobaculia bacterium]|jgi:hypothetical protein|nr:hypothetical protein [Thermoanaerobaculia bacterium]